MRHCDCGRDTCTICTFGFDPADRMPAEQQTADGWRPKRTYLINLKRRQERLAHALDECHRVGLEPIVYEAVDGRTTPGRPATWQAGGGAWGCRESHVGVLNECIRDGIKSVLVLEDDIRFSPDFVERFPKFIADLPSDWQAAFIGGQHLSMPNVVKGKPNIVQCGGEKGCHRTHAYIVRGAYLQQLRDLFASCNTHIDHAWGAAQKGHKGIYAPVPWLAYQAESASDINGRAYDKERRWEARTVRDGGAIRPAAAIVPQQRKGCVSCGKKGRA